MTTTWEKVSSNARLISLPEVYLRLRETLDQADFSMRDVASVVSKDPGLTARLLRLVNSPYFGLASTVDTVFRAVNVLGTKQVYDLTLATSVTQSFEGMSNEVMDMSIFWRKSVFCGLASTLLAKQCNVLNCERLFVAGLLRDLGHLIMYQSLPDLSQQAIRQAHEKGVSLYLMERELIGIDYARIGGILMRQWQLPASLRESTEFHIEPGRSLDFRLETSIVHIAALLTEAMMSDDDFGSGVLQPHPDTLAITGLSIEQCSEIQNAAEIDVDGMLRAILPLSGKVSL